MSKASNSLLQIEFSDSITYKKLMELVKERKFVPSSVTINEEFGNLPFPTLILTVPECYVCEPFSEIDGFCDCRSSKNNYSPEYLEHLTEQGYTYEIVKDKEFSS